MPHRARELAALSVAFAAAACASAPRANLQEEEQRIRELERRWGEAITAKDMEATMAMYAPDAVFMVANAPPATGHAEIRQGLGQLFREPNLSLQITPLRVEVARSGDLAYDFGRYRLVFDGAHGRVDDEGNYTVVWRKIDGQWKAVVDMPISGEPLPTPPPSVATVVVDGPEAQLHAAAGLQWTDLRAPGFKPGAQLAVIHGDPTGTGDYTLRLRFPDGYEFPPHWHPQAEHVTVLQGEFMLGMGERYDRAALRSYAPGDFLYAPAKMPHFGGVRGETVVQLHGVGPFEIRLAGPTP